MFGAPSAPRLAPSLAVVGVAAIWSPLAFLGIVELYGIPGGIPGGIVTLIGLWAVASVLGFVAMMLGITGMAERSTPRLPSRVHAVVDRVGLLAGIALLLGFAVLVGTIAFAESCQSPCTGGGGVMGSTQLAAASCGGVCALSIGPSQLLWPIQLLAIAITLDVVGGVLATVAVVRAIGNSRSHRLKLAG